MNAELVLDAGILALHFADHPAVRSYFDALIHLQSKGMICSVNLAEFYYKACRKLGKQTADAWYFQIRRSGIEVVYNEGLARQAALEKCRQTLSLALADCFALALAKAEHALLLTTDSELAKVKGVKVRHFKI